MVPSLISISLIAALSASASADDDSPTWRFKKPDRPVKVVVMSGSIGAYKRKPYHRRLQNVCSNIEVKNLAKTGIGAHAIKKRFRKLVLDNPNVRPERNPDHEYWVLVAAGINSLYSPESANHHFKNLIVLAHMAQMKTLALSPTPWGTDRGDKHQGYEGLRRRKATQLVADFMLGKLGARQALGKHASKRPAGPDGAWVPLEVPDVAVDVYDSPLRDREAQARDKGAMRKLLAKNRVWKRAHADLDEADREAALDADAKLAAEVPQWFMRRELQAFDSVHPNTDGHRIIAQTVCPELPASWGCACDGL